MHYILIGIENLIDFADLKQQLQWYNDHVSLQGNMIMRNVRFGNINPDKDSVFRTCIDKEAFGEYLKEYVFGLRKCELAGLVWAMEKNGKILKPKHQYNREKLCEELNNLFFPKGGRMFTPDSIKKGIQCQPNDLGRKFEKLLKEVGQYYLISPI